MLVWSDVAVDVDADMCWCDVVAALYSFTKLKIYHILPLQC